MHRGVLQRSSIKWFQLPNSKEHLCLKILQAWKVSPAGSGGETHGVPQWMRDPGHRLCATGAPSEWVNTWIMST